MKNTATTNILEELKKLLAIKSSLEVRLDEYNKIITLRDNEIQMLQAMLAESTAYRSNLDNSIHEMTEFQQHIKRLQQLVDIPLNIMSNSQQYIIGANTITQQLEDIKLQYSYLQSQHATLEAQLVDVYNRNLLLVQQASRVTELESLLNIAEEEISNIKRRDGWNK